MSASKLLESLDLTTLKAVKSIHRTLTTAGHECYLVGGCVRDLILGRPAGDVDLTTNARPKQVQALFRKTIPTGLQHGTITVRMHGLSFEVTTYRAESTYSDGRHPDAVHFSDSISQDLERRDFTMNALALEPGTGELIDEHGGQADLAARQVRTIGEARDRFFEDGLRSIRACRFAAVLDFEIEEKTRSALSDAEVQRRTAGVAVERIAQELWKGLRAREVSRMIGALDESGLIGAVLPRSPEYRPLSPQDRNHCDLLHNCAPALRLAFWWRSGQVADLTIAARALKLARNAERDITNYDKLLQFISGEIPNSVTIRRFLSPLMKSYGRQQLAVFLNGAQSVPGPVWNPATVRALQGALEFPLTVQDLAISGRDLLAAGLSGPAVGERLAFYLDRVLEDPNLNTREQLLALRAPETIPDHMEKK